MESIGRLVQQAEHSSGLSINDDDLAAYCRAVVDGMEFMAIALYLDRTALELCLQPLRAWLRTYVRAGVPGMEPYIPKGQEAERIKRSCLQWADALAKALSMPQFQVDFAHVREPVAAVEVAAPLSVSEIVTGGSSAEW
jgi:hypothetical protein